MKKIWIITKDCRNVKPSENEEGTFGTYKFGCCVYRGGKAVSKTHNEQTSISEEEKKNLNLYGHKFIMLDDDGVICYEGSMSHELADSEDILIPLDDFGTPNEGCTSLELWSNISEEWEMV